MERVYWIAWCQMPGVGAVMMQRLQKYFGSATEAWQAPTSSLNAVEGFGSKSLEAIAAKKKTMNPEEFFEQHNQKNPNYWIPSDAEYPKLLLEIPSPPPILYYQGKVDPKETQGIIPIVAIVGTREPTEHGKRWTRKLSSALTKSGFVLISGMAAGIDGEAHKACLEAGGRTIAVLGTGVDITYPAKHKKLHEEIREQGLILSEYPAGTQPAAGNFPPRNRIIAGLSRAVLIIEAPEKSGSLITARYALDFNRDVYALPNTPDNPQARGCLRLIQQGAEMIINEAQLLEALGVMPALDSKTIELLLPNENNLKSKAHEEIMPDLDPPLQQILQVIPSSSPVSFDLIVQTSGLNVGDVSGGLIQLQLFGLVSELPGMRYQRS